MSLDKQCIGEGHLGEENSSLINEYLDGGEDAREELVRTVSVNDLCLSKDSLFFTVLIFPIIVFDLRDLTWSIESRLASGENDEREMRPAQHLESVLDEVDTDVVGVADTSDEPRADEQRCVEERMPRRQPVACKRVQ